MADPPTRHGEKIQLPAMTGVRALAAFMVLLLHASQNFPNTLVKGALSNRGYLGVDLFFLLSGFIIAHVYLFDLVPLRARSLRIFLWHRFIRLFPAHAAVLLALVGLIVALRSMGVDLAEPRSWSYRDLPWHFMMMHAWGTTNVAGWNAPSWSISAEWFAYLLFPAIAAFTLALSRFVALPFALLCVLAAAIVFQSLGWGLGSAWIGAPALLRVSSEFACGVLLYRAIRIDLGDLPPWVLDALAFGSLVAFAVTASRGGDDFVLIGLLAGVIAGVSGQGAFVRAAFGNRPVVWLGEISYSIYLVHFPVLLVLRHGVNHVVRFQFAETEAMRLFLFAVSIVVVVGAASVSYYLVEHPARRRWRNAVGTIDASPIDVMGAQALQRAATEPVKTKP